MKKITAFLLAALMLASFTACGEKGASSNPAVQAGSSSTAAENASEKTEEAETVNVFSMRITANPDSEVIQQLNEKLGVKFAVTSVPDADYDTKLNLFVASDSMPDVYGAQPTGTKDAMRAAATLTEDLIQTNMPEIYNSFLSRVKKAGVSKDTILSRWTFDGELKGFSNGNGQIAPYGIIIRTDILNELGVDIPQTIADWDELLALYKAKYPEKYPLTRMNGQDSQAFYMFLAAYGVRRDDWTLVNNQLEYAPFAPGMRDALLKLHEWYEAGYINPEYYAMYSQAGTEWAEFINGNTFFGQMYHPNNEMEGPDYTEGTIPANCLANNPEAAFDWCPFPTLGDGSKPVVWAGDTFSGYIPCFGGHLAEDPDKFNKVMQVWNALFSDEELYRLMRFGIEGKHHDLVDGVPVVRPEYGSNDAKGKEGFGWPFNGAFDPIDEIVPSFTASYVNEQREKLLEGDGMYSRETVIYSNDPRVNGPLVSSSGEDLNAKNSSWLTEWNTMYTAVIIGQKTIEDYDAFIADWKAAVGDEMVQVANDTYLTQWLE